MYNVSVQGRLEIEQKIHISDQKNVTIIGFVDDDFKSASNPSGYTVISAGQTASIFSVSNGSTLDITRLTLEGGFSGEGGAVAVTSSSVLRVLDCGFANNEASTAGGKKPIRS